MVERVNSSTDELHIHLTPTVRPNWEKLADLVGFDEWDRLALRYRLAGASRDRAMAEQPDETSRKALQAAWRKFDRRGVGRLQEANGGRLEVAQRMANHASSRTTGVYDPRGEDISFDDVERIGI